MLQKNKKLTDDYYIYNSFLATIIIFGILAILYKCYFYKYIEIPLCFFYIKCGVYCPACGMTRAFLSLIKGDFFKAIYYNPAFVYVVIAVAVYMISATICKILKKDIIIKYKNTYLYIGIGILIINCIIRNILLIGYGIRI